jgi:hypothetical protein
MLPIVLPFGRVAAPDPLLDRRCVRFVGQRGTHHGLFMEFVLVLDSLQDAHNVGFQYHPAHDLLLFVTTEKKKGAKDNRRHGKGR